MNNQVYIIIKKKHFQSFFCVFEMQAGWMARGKPFHVYDLKFPVFSIKGMH